MIRALGTLTTVIVLPVFVGAHPAHAVDELGLSPDGQTWSGHLDGPLFDPAIRWVPGDTRQAAFYVRNQADDGGTLTIAVESRDPDRLLRDDDIKLSARVGSDSWVVLAPSGQANHFNEGAIPAHTVRKVRVKASFDPASGNRSQRSKASFRFRVTLSGESATPDDEKPDGTDEPDRPDGADNPNPDADLPNTGAPAVGWWIIAAGVAMGIGLGIMKRRSGKEAQHGTSC